MHIEDIDNGGFVETIENGIVKKVVCSNENGICIVYFYDKPPIELNVGCSVYNRQYGIPVSEDGSKLFIGSWEKGFGGLEKGLMAYDTTSGSLLWRLAEGKIRHIIVYQNYLITLKTNAAIFKVDISSGAILDQIKSGTIENLYNLGFPYVLVDAVVGKLCIIDVESMSITKKYGSKHGSKLINPSNCLSVLIQSATLQGNTLTISGVEQEHFNRTFDVSNHKSFSRIIDADFGSNFG